MMRYLVTLLVILSVGMAGAAQAQRKGDDQETKKTVAMSQDVYESLQKAQEDLLQKS